MFFDPYMYVHILNTSKKFMMLEAIIMKLSLFCLVLIEDLDRDGGHLGE